jgi:class 3 adenylate cyclase
MQAQLLAYVQTALQYAEQAPAYVQATWEGALYLYEPKLAAVAAGAALALLVLRVFVGGWFGWLVRTAAYAGLFYLLIRNEQFILLFPEAETQIIIAATAMVMLWLPITVLGGFVRLIRAPKRSAIAAGAPMKSGTGEAFDIRRNEHEQKKQMVIMMTDIVGYSAKMEKDEAATYALLKEHNIIMRKAITTNRGKEIKTIGDAFMVVFDSPLDAVRCGMAMQKGLFAFNKPRPVNDHVKVRIGIHRGEVIVTGKDVFGEGVNIAARMESITDPGGISISADVYEQVRNKIEAGFQSIGIPKMKNIANPPEVFKIHLNLA